MQVPKAGAMVVALSVGITLFSPNSPVQAAPRAATERHCVVEVTGESDGMLETGPEQCFKSKLDADRYDPATNGVTTSGGASTTENTIGVHFTGLSFTGSSIRIVGTVCNGGTWPATGSWNNNIEWVRLR